MAKAVKKPAPKNARGNKTRTKKPAVAKKAPLAQKPVAAARTARSSGTAARPKQAARPARPPAEEGPKAPRATAEAPRPPAPRPALVPAPAPPAQGTTKPGLIRLSSLEPGAAARLTAVRNLLDAQGRHDLPGLLACLGPEPTLEFAGGPRHSGQERVGQIYGDLLRAFPDLTLEILAEHVADRSVIVELVMQGTHRQQWLGMAPRGRTLTLPAAYVFLFDKRDQISAVRIYLDRNLAIVQLTSGLLR